MNMSKRLRNTSTDELDRVYKVRFVLVVVKITGINSGYVSQCSFFLFSQIASIYYQGRIQGGAHPARAPPP